MIQTKTRRAGLLALAALALAASTATAALLHDLTGTWKAAVVTDNGTGYPTITLKQDGEKITGTYDSPTLGLRNITGKVVGDSLHFSLSAGQDASMVLTYSAAIVTADSLNGAVDFAGQGGAKFTAVRQK